ncbi:MAG TPA: GrpB family protein [Thermomicrobiales bacterium]|nr:GrpB family protein [Thermomicrobiales bacterium]
MGEPPIRPYPFPSPPPALRPWNPRAPEVAARVVALIAERLPETTVEHVGSSSVPGCAGKGVLDLAIPYRDESHLGAINDALFALGFGRQRNRDPFPETRPMRIGAIDDLGETFLLHVHVVPDRTHHLVELVDFRDRLRADPVLVAEYVTVKRAILDAGVRDGVDYAEKKGTFISALGYKGAEDD